MPPEWLEYSRLEFRASLHAGVVQNANPLNVPVSNMYKLLRMPDLAQRLKVYKESLALVRLKLLPTRTVGEAVYYPVHCSHDTASCALWSLQLSARLLRLAPTSVAISRPLALATARHRCRRVLNCTTTSPC